MDDPGGARAWEGACDVVAASRRVVATASRNSQSVFRWAKKQKVMKVYDVRRGAACALVWVVVLLCITITAAIHEKDSTFLHFGPSETTVFAGIRIDTWAKWSAVMTYSCMSQVVYSVVSNSLSPFVTNVIQDHKTPCDEKGPYRSAQAAVQIYTLYHWISSIFDVFLWVTLQMQYILPALVADQLLSFIFTHRYMQWKDVPRDIMSVSLH